MSTAPIESSPTIRYNNVTHARWGEFFRLLGWDFTYDPSSFERTGTVFEVHGRSPFRVGFASEQHLFTDRTDLDTEPCQWVIVPRTPLLGGEGNGYTEYAMGRCNSSQGQYEEEDECFWEGLASFTTCYCGAYGWAEYYGAWSANPCGHGGKEVWNDFGWAELSYLWSRAVASAPKAMKSAHAGVYVYSYPMYLAGANEAGRSLFKVGCSRTCIDDRIAFQNRQTPMPEEIEVVRRYYTPDAFAMESKFHQVLKTLGTHHKEASNGAEWFLTDLNLIDTIAGYLGLADGSARTDHRSHQ